MTPEEKAKHLEALERMFQEACGHVEEFNGDVTEESAEWCAAIDAFKAVPVFAEELLQPFECAACGYAHASITFDRDGTRRECARCGEPVPK